MPQVLTIEYNMKNYSEAMKGLRSIGYTIEGTSIISNIDNIFVLDVDEIDTPEKLIGDVNLMQSVEQARQEMRSGTVYFSHKDVFGR